MDLDDDALREIEVPRRWHHVFDNGLAWLKPDRTTAADARVHPLVAPGLFDADASQPNSVRLAFVHDENPEAVPGRRLWRDWIRSLVDGEPAVLERDGDARFAKLGIPVSLPS